ncbi:tetratricopeptide repeat protein [Planctomicrobium sp. SH664]|uniref:tetratricopeptide repeat protein n=1 Tax=Planctomicrobium sp. SH664 TaxID=3448125 RepID=UPI003F5B1FF5
MNDTIRRAHLLLTQGRFQMAEGELRRALASDSQNATYHSLLAYALLAQKRYDDAESEARTAIGLDPDDALSCRALGAVLIERRKFKAAAQIVDRALELDPFSEQAWSQRAELRIEASDWQGALDASNKGLEIDPHDVTCNNLRALALTKLGRRAEAGQTLGAALARDPEDALTHANQGWALLEAGQRDAALEHFKESLRLDPNSDWAKQGVVEALKSKNIIYRVLLRYFFMMARLSPRTQTGIIIGAYVLQRLLAALAKTYPAIAPVVIPLLLLYGAFVLVSWLGSPLLDLLLLTDRLGRITLSKLERLNAIFVGSVFGLILLLLTSTFLLETDPGMRLLLIWGTVNLGLLLLPSSAILRCEAGYPRWTLAAGCGALALIGLLPFAAWFIASFLPGIPVDMKAAPWRYTPMLFIPGIIGMQLLANSMVSKTPER